MALDIKTKDEVFEAIDKYNVRFVRIWFTDILGVPKSFAINPSELEGAFSEGMGFDGSSIQGFARIHESDMVAKPDPTTFSSYPGGSRKTPWPGCSAISRIPTAALTRVIPGTS